MTFEFNILELSKFIGAIGVIIAFFWQIFRGIKKVVNVGGHIIKRLEDVEISTLRLEYLNMRQHNPNNEIAIDEIYHKYSVEKKGNSYITQDYSNYKNERKK